MRGPVDGLCEQTVSVLPAWYEGLEISRVPFPQAAGAVDGLVVAGLPGDDDDSALADLPHPKRRVPERHPVTEE